MRVHHIAIVTNNLVETQAFLEIILGYRQHHKVSSWFVPSDEGPDCHVIEIDDTKPNEEDLFHYYKHCAFEVSSLRVILERVISHSYSCFQMNIDGDEQEIVDSNDSLSFGLKTLFVRDKQGNLWEFLEKGHSLNQLWT